MNTNNNSEEEFEEPLTISIERASRLTNESKTTIYNLIADGELEAVKSRRRTLVIYASVKRRLANLPRVELKRKWRKARCV